MHGNPNSTSIEIFSLTHDGRGIGQIQGKTTFVEGALPGETVEFNYTSKRGKYDEGKATQITTPSMNRLQPRCQHFGVCGGCALQHLNHSEQLKLKQQLLLDQFQHFGGIQPTAVLPAITGPVWNYRRKARLSVKYVGKKQSVLVGFHEKNGRYIADLQRCEILAAPLDNLLMPLRELIQSLSAYQQIPQIEVAVGDDITALVFRHLVPLADTDIAQLKNFAQQHQLRIYLQPKGPKTAHLIYPENASSELLSYRLPPYNLELDFGPTDFIQINAEINLLMLERALNLLDLQLEDRVLDLFCGIGNFSLPIARFCHAVVGVEGDADLIAQAGKNATKNQIDNAQFYPADLSVDFNSAPWAQQSFTKILLDPPRVGALQVVQNIARFNAQSIVYVSCNPATLARDAGELATHGYQLTKVGIMDMFPHTHHVEAIALFVRK